MGEFLARFLAVFGEIIFMKEELFSVWILKGLFCGILSEEVCWIVWGLPKTDYEMPKI